MLGINSACRKHFQVPNLYCRYKGRMGKLLARGLDNADRAQRDATLDYQLVKYDWL